MDKYTDHLLNGIGNRHAYETHVSNNPNVGIHVSCSIMGLKALHPKDAQSVINQHSNVLKSLAKEHTGHIFRHQNENFRCWFANLKGAGPFARAVRSLKIPVHIGLGHDPKQAEQALEISQTESPTESVIKSRLAEIPENWAEGQHQPVLYKNFEPQHHGLNLVNPLAGFGSHD